MENTFTTILNTRRIQERFLFKLGIALTNNVSTLSICEPLFTETHFHRVKRENGSCGLSEASQALLDKAHTMMFYKGNFKAVVRMLYSFRYGTKRRLHSYQLGKDHNWIDKDGNEIRSMGANDQRAHFRWNMGTRYSLTDKELEGIELFLGVIDEKEIDYVPRTRNAKIREVSDVEEFLKETKTTVSINYVGLNKNKTNHVYSLTITNPRHTFVSKYRTGLTLTTVTPTCVLESLEKYEPTDSFEDFCHEFDYNADSIKHLELYRNVVAEWKAVNKLFTEKEIEKLIEILE